MSLVCTCIVGSQGRHLFNSIAEFSVENNPDRELGCLIHPLIQQTWFGLSWKLYLIWFFHTLLILDLRCLLLSQCPSLPNIFLFFFFSIPQPSVYNGDNGRALASVAADQTKPCKSVPDYDRTFLLRFPHIHRSIWTQDTRHMTQDPASYLSPWLLFLLLFPASLKDKTSLLQLSLSQSSPKSSSCPERLDKFI